MQARFFPFAFALIVGFCGIAYAKGESAEVLIGKGNLHYDKLEPAKALEFYLPAEEQQPNNADLLVRISRQFRHLASDSSRTADKLKLGNTAVGYSRRAVRLAPNDPETQLSLAISLGRVMPLLGNKDRVAASKEVKAAAEKATKLDPQNDLSWHVLGRWHLVMSEVGPVTRKLATIIYGSMPDSSNEDAKKHFEKAISLNPNRLMHYIELGRTYANLGDNEQAKKYLTKGLGMANTEKDDSETKAKGRELLAKLR